MTAEFMDFLRNEKGLMARSLIDYQRCFKILGPILYMKAYAEVSAALLKIKKDRNLQDCTIYKMVVMASEWFKWRVRRGDLDKNPLQDHAFKKNAKHRIEFFDWNDPKFKKLFTNPHLTIRIKCILHVLKSSGIRSNELCHLKVKNVQGRWLDIENGKGGVHRTAPIDEETRFWLGVYIEGLQLHYNGEWLFPREDYSGPMTPGNLGKILTRMGHKCGMKIYPHKFRHSLAGHLINKGCDISVAADVLGHKDIRTTQIYTHFTKPQILTKYDDALKSL